MPHPSRRRAEIATWLALREREGLTYQDLSDRCGLAASTLSWWSWRLRRESKRPTGGFTELSVVEDARPKNAVSTGLCLRVADIVIDIPHGFDADDLGRVLDVVRGRC